MSGRPTPETDSKPKSVEFGAGAIYPTVSVIFARKLEHERDEARKLARWFYTRLKQVCLDRGILARLEKAVLDDPWLEAAK